jgi:hypothetical protein
MTRREVMALPLLSGILPGIASAAFGAELFAVTEATRPDYVKTLEAVFGGPSQTGFGSTVLFATARDRGELVRLARAAYRHFTGTLWERWGEAAWMGPWRLIHERVAVHNVLAELKGLEDPQARSGADMLLNATENPASGQAALSATFDDPAVQDLLVFSLGDGGAMSGILIAARRANGEATFLVFLMD